MPLKAGLLLAVAVVSALPAADLSAQGVQIIRRTRHGPAGAKEDAVDEVFPPPPREKLKLLSDCNKLMADGRLGEAVRKLGEILESSEDYLVQPDKNAPGPNSRKSLKGEAERLLGEMPREGRELYELQYGARARQMLAEALEAGNMERMAEVSRRFFHTRAGYQATFLLGLDHFDHDRSMAGALVLQRLRQAGPAVDDLEPALSMTLAACWLKSGMPEKARDTLSALRARDPAMRVTVGGREVPLFEDDAAAVEWLSGLIGPQPPAPPEETDRWWMFRGNAARNASALGGPPLLNLRWRVQATDDPLAEADLDQCQRIFAENANPVLPAFHPLAVGNVLLMRTLQDLTAVDFNTGKLLWWTKPMDEGADSSGGADPQARQSQAANAGQRLWKDLTFGTLSSDGRYVFSIEDLDPDDPQQSVPVIVRRGIRFGMWGMINPGGEQPPVFNRLAAHDIRTGKLAWELGGPAGPHALRQPETFFLGPPLVLMGQLYVLAENRGEMRLMALEAATGNVLWSQQLSLAEQADPQRRSMGVSPSYADGVLVCPTATGAIVGVELATRSLLWGYCYSQENDVRDRGIAQGFMGAAGSRWADGSASIRDGRVIITPPESDFLYCLSLIDGTFLWKCPRQDAGHDDLYVACVDRDKVVLVGRHAVRAVQLSDGKPAWGGRTVPLPKHSAPSGRGFENGNRYFLPLTSAEVVAIDLAEGKLAGRWKSRKGNVPGNLICHQGKIISQGADGVSAFFQLDTVSADVRRRLAANPSDPEALSLQGEILLGDDKFQEAIASFRRAYRLAPDSSARELLRDSLLEGLRTDFAAYRGQSAEIERLLDDASTRAAFLRAMAVGLRRAGEWAPAFDSYVKLADLEPERRPLDAVDASLLARRDRWIQSQTAELRKQASPEAAAAIDKSLAARLRSALAARSLEPLREFVNCFGNQPAAAAASGELVRRLRSAGRLLEAELADAAAGEAHGSQPAGLGATQPTGEADEDVKWPTGKVEVSTTHTRNLGGLYQASFPVDWQDPHPLFADVALRFDYGRVAIVAYDGYGVERWQVSLMENGQRQDFGFSPNRSHARAIGHLLLVSLAWKIVAIDTLGLGAKGAPRVLWIEDLTGAARNSAQGRRLAPPLQMLPIQFQQQFVQSSDGASLSGASGSRQICAERLRDVVALDPCSGETLWARQGFSSGCELFGDDRYVFVLSPDREEATLLNASDGELLGKRKIPRLSGTQVLPNGETRVTYSPLEASSLGTFGRNVLLWWPEGDKRVLTLVDPLEGRDVWAGWKFAASAHAFVVDDEAVGVMEPSGHFVLLSLPDGRTIADVKLEAEPTLQEITVFRGGEGYFLLTRGGATAGPVPPMMPMPNAVFRAYSPIQRGRLYAFSPAGKLLWPAPALIENQLLLGNQPGKVPVLIFGCQQYQQAPNGQGRWRPTLLCVDKRSGKAVYQGQLDNQIGLFGVRCDPEKKTVELIVQNDTVTLKFTDKPAPSPPAGAPAAKPADKPHPPSRPAPRPSALAPKPKT